MNYENMSLLLGESVKVVKAKNKTYIGLKGIVVYEKAISTGYYIVIQDPETGIQKLVQNCIVQISAKKIRLNLDTLSKKELKGINYTGICY